MGCDYCKEEMQEGAIKCKYCGSMLAGEESIKKNANSAIIRGNYTSYSQVPWYRKNWFAILCALILTPALFLILITGSVYYESKGKIKKYSKTAKVILIIWSSLSILAVFKAILS